MADYRKIIKFGKNSLIISLPKEWATANKLVAGDSVNVDQLTNHLLITPLRQDVPKPSNDYTFTIDGEDIEVTKKRILRAYLNNCDTITLRGKNLLSKNKFIRNAVHQYVALEIIEETPKKIHAKCYLNMHDINADNLVRKIDAILKSMFTDLGEQLSGKLPYKNDELTRNFSERDTDVNRLSFLLMRSIKYLIENPHEVKGNKVDATLLNKWDIAQILEKIGDEIKRLSRIVADLSGKQLIDLQLLLKKTAEHYNNIMRAYYRKDVDVANELSLFRKTMAQLFEDHQPIHEEGIPSAKALQRLKTLFYRVDELIMVFD